MAVYAGEGTVITVDTVAIGEIISVKLGSIEQGGVDTFGLSSTAKTQRAGLPDFGSVSVDFYFDEANAAQQSLLTKSKNKADVDVVITFTSGGGVTITGFVTKFEWSGMEVDSNVQCSVEIKINEFAYAD